MIKKKDLVEQIEETYLEKISGERDIWEKHVFLDDNKVLIVGYAEEEKFEEGDPDEETVNTYYWYWELRDSDSWEVIFENQDKDYSFCESEHGNYSDDDQIEDVVGDIDEKDICKWSEQDWIEDISDPIAANVLEWLKTLQKN